MDERSWWVGGVIGLDVLVGRRSWWVGGVVW